MSQPASTARMPRLSRRSTLAGTLASSAALFWKQAAAVASPELGQAWQGLPLIRRTGQGFRLEDLPGRLVVVAFWDASCQVCRDEIPALGRALVARGPGDTSLLLVSFPTAWDQDYAAAMRFGLASHACTVSVEADPYMLAAAINERNGQYRVPQCFVFDRAINGGKLGLRFAKTGRLHWPDGFV